MSWVYTPRKYKTQFCGLFLFPYEDKNYKITNTFVLNVALFSTALVVRFLTKRFIWEYDPTLGTSNFVSSFSPKFMPHKKECHFLLHLVDVLILLYQILQRIPLRSWMCVACCQCLDP